MKRAFNVLFAIALLFGLASTIAANAELATALQASDGNQLDVSTLRAAPVAITAGARMFSCLRWKSPPVFERETGDRSKG